MLIRPEESKMLPQTKIEATDVVNRPEESKMSPQQKIKERKDIESLNDELGKVLRKLVEKRWSLLPILFINLLILILLVAGVTWTVVYYPREPARSSVQQLYENQKKVLQDIGCSPKPEVRNMLSLLPEKDEIEDYEIEERFIVILQCNDHSSFCEVNIGKCTCEPTENGQKNATVIIKFRNRHAKNSEWQYVHRTLNIKNHTECVAKAII